MKHTIKIIGWLVTIAWLGMIVYYFNNYNKFRCIEKYSYFEGWYNPCDEYR